VISVADVAYYQRALRMYARDRDIALMSDDTISHPFGSEPDSKERACAWMLESLLYALRELTRTAGTDQAIVLRSLLHAREQLGRMGGYYSGMPIAHDCAIALQNHLESLARKGAA
jgi:hypothetical protein